MVNHESFEYLLFWYDSTGQSWREGVGEGEGGSLCPGSWDGLLTILLFTVPTEAQKYCVKVQLHRPYIDCITMLISGSALPFLMLILYAYYTALHQLTIQCFS